MSHIKVLAALVIQLAHTGRQWGMASSAGSLLPTSETGEEFQVPDFGLAVVST